MCTFFLVSSLRKGLSTLYMTENTPGAVKKKNFQTISFLLSVSMMCFDSEKVERWKNATLAQQ